MGCPAALAHTRMGRTVLADNGDFNYGHILKTHLPHPLFIHIDAVWIFNKWKVIQSSLEWSQIWRTWLQSPNIKKLKYTKINAVAVCTPVLCAQTWRHLFRLIICVTQRRLVTACPTHTWATGAAAISLVSSVKARLSYWNPSWGGWGSRRVHRLKQATVWLCLYFRARWHFLLCCSH